MPSQIIRCVVPMLRHEPSDVFIDIYTAKHLREHEGDRRRYEKDRSDHKDDL